MSLVHKGVGLQVFYEQCVGESTQDNPNRFQALVNAYRDDYSANSDNRPYPFAKELLDDLRHSRPTLSLAIATTKPSSMATLVLEHSNLAHYFDVILGTDDLPHKPDPALLFEVCRRTSITPQLSTMVGDTDRDIGAAQAAPMTSIGICHGGWKREELATLAPTHLVDDLKELHSLFTAS